MKVHEAQTWTSSESSLTCLRKLQMFGCLGGLRSASMLISVPQLGIFLVLGACFQRQALDFQTKSWGQMPKIMYHPCAPSLPLGGKTSLAGCPLTFKLTLTDCVKLHQVYAGPELHSMSFQHQGWAQLPQAMPNHSASFHAPSHIAAGTCLASIVT